MKGRSCCGCAGVKSAALFVATGIGGLLLGRWASAAGETGLPGF